MNDGNFDLLRTLIAVAESPNFRAAADRLGLSQPAVTLKMQQLEDLHPVPVFMAEGRRKVLTRYGRDLYQRAKAGTARLDQEIENLKRLYASAKHLQLRIGGRLDVLRYVVQWLEFDGKIELIDCSSDEAVERLQRHEIDMAITYQRPDSTTLYAKPLFRSHVLLRVHEKWVGRRKGNLFEDPEFLKTTPCILYRPEGHLLRDVLRPLKIDISELDIKFVSESWSLIQSLIDEGAGYSALPFYVTGHSDQVKEVEIPPGISPPYEFYAVYEMGMRKMEAFKPLLSFRKLKGL